MSWALQAELLIHHPDPLEEHAEEDESDEAGSGAVDRFTSIFTSGRWVDGSLTASEQMSTVTFVRLWMSVQSHG